LTLRSQFLIVGDPDYGNLCSMDTPIMKPCRVGHTCMCIFKNSSRVRVSCPFQYCHVRAM